MIDIKTLFQNYKNFQECILLDIKWFKNGTPVELKFDYIWDADGKIRKNLNEEKPIIIRFGLVQEFFFKSALNQAMIREPQEINWGINEISCIKFVEKSDSLKKYKGFQVPFYHVQVLWENERQIDIICSIIEIVYQKLSLL